MIKRSASDRYLEESKYKKVEVRLPEGQEYEGTLQDFDDWCIIVDGAMIERGAGIRIQRKQ